MCACEHVHIHVLRLESVLMCVSVSDCREGGGGGGNRKGFMGNLIELDFRGGWERKAC